LWSPAAIDSAIAAVVTIMSSRNVTFHPMPPNAGAEPPGDN
jgi:hypothetical protein